jgi:hypothetical protein
MKKSVLFSTLPFLLLIIFSINFIVASDVAYVYNSKWHIDDNILDSFSDLGLDIDTIQCGEVDSTDFSEYGLIFVGEEYLGCADEIPVEENPSVIMNGRNTKELGISNMISTSSSRPKIKSSGEFFQAYTKIKYSKSSLSLYSLSDYSQNGFTKIAESFMADTLDLGAAVAHIHSGSQLVNEKTANANICFFGFHETRFWTTETEDLFEECVEFVIGPLGLIHDVALSDLKIKNTTNDLVEGSTPQLKKDESYKILIDLTNLGDFTEDVDFEGEIKEGDTVVETFSHVAVNNLDPGETKNDKSKTLTFDMDKGAYEIIVRAVITDTDYYPNNNILSVTIEVI